MKKILVLLLMASMVEASFSSTYYMNREENRVYCMDALPIDSQIRQRCGVVGFGIRKKTENKETCDIIAKYLAISSGFESSWFSGIDRKELDESLDVLVDADKKNNEEKNIDVTVEKLKNRIIVA